MLQTLYMGVVHATVWLPAIEPRSEVITNSGSIRNDREDRPCTSSATGLTRFPTGHEIASLVVEIDLPQSEA